MKFRYKLNALYPDSQVHFPQPQSVAMGWDDRGPHLRMFLEDAQEYEAHTVRLGLVTDDPFVLGLVVRWFRHGQELRAPIYTPVNIHRLGGMHPPNVAPPQPNMSVKLSTHLIHADTGQLVGLCGGGVEYEWGRVLYERVHRQLELGDDLELWTQRVAAFERHFGVTQHKDASALIEHVSVWAKL